MHPLRGSRLVGRSIGFYTLASVGCCWGVGIWANTTIVMVPGDSAWGQHAQVLGSCSVPRPGADALGGLAARCQQHSTHCDASFHGLGRHQTTWVGGGLPFVVVLMIGNVWCCTTAPCHSLWGTRRHPPPPVTKFCSGGGCCLIAHGLPPAHTCMCAASLGCLPAGRRLQAEPLTQTCGPWQARLPRHRA